MVDLGDAETIDQLVENFRGAITGQLPASHIDRDLSVARESESFSGENLIEEIRRGRIAASISPQRDLLPGQQGIESNAFLSAGNRLRERIFDPLLSVLGNISRLILAPDGSLNLLPFEVLPLSSDTYLIDRYRPSYVSVGRDVLRFGFQTGREPEQPLVAGGPNFDLGMQRDETRINRQLFTPLDGTLAEAEEVAAVLHVEPLMEDDVLEGVIKSRRSPRILHLATHGFFRPNPGGGEQALSLSMHGWCSSVEGRWKAMETIEDPLVRSGLALAGANTWLRGDSPPAMAEDGILTAADVSGLDLVDTELVVLSACETGLGDVHVGEGVFGLRRAFPLAGAKTLVMSLWKVHDEQTKKLMIDFYHRLETGTPRSEALREAQLAVRSRAPHPVNWGAFICQGDPGALLA
jgi:CHAT domain-containing protein